MFVFRFTTSLKFTPPDVHQCITQPHHEHDDFCSTAQFTGYFGEIFVKNSLSIICFFVFIQSIDYSYNEIEEFPQDLGGFSSLTKLVIDGNCTKAINDNVFIITIGNQLTSLCGLSALVSLTFLSLSDNRIDSLNGLDSLPIKTLIVVRTLHNYMYMYILYISYIESLHIKLSATCISIILYM